MPDKALDESFALCPHFKCCQELPGLLVHLDTLYAAFPDKDTEGHHDYHEAKIQAARAEEAFWQEARYDLRKKGLFSIILLVLGLLGYGIVVKLKVILGIPN